MLSNQISSDLNNFGITKFMPAVLKEKKGGWIIEYYSEDPQNLVLARKQIKLARIMSRYSSVKDARVHATSMVQALNVKLAGGWSPFYMGEDVRMREKLSSVTELFLKEKKKESRANTMRSYSSFVNLLNEWVDKTSPNLLASMFNKVYAVKYMDYVYNTRDVGVTTYNNHIKMARALFNWMRERCYITANPFIDIKLKPKQPKTRILIPSDVRENIISHLDKQNSNFLIVCKLVYSALLRPNEIRLLKVGDINLKEKYIHVDRTVSKNKKTRYPALTPDLIESLEKLNLDKYPKSYHLLSSHMLPDKNPAGNGCYGGAWDKLRLQIKLDRKMQLYSLRDSGIHEMLKSGINDLSVMQHADHSSLQMTTLYGNHHDPQLNQLIFDKAPKF